MKPRLFHWFLPLLLWGCSDSPSPATNTPDTKPEPSFEAPTVQLTQAQKDACLLCHSNKEMQRGPVLDGMEEWYVLEQLKKFKSGLRGADPSNKAETLMASAMKDIEGEGTLLAYAQFIANLPPQPSLTTVKADPERGKTLYGQCASCHGPDAKGKPEMKAPGLLIQEDWFLLDQLRKYKLGLRGNQPGDAFATIMAASVKTWSDQDLKDVVAYLDRL